MINGYRYRPLAEIYSIIVVHSRWPGSFLKVFCFSIMPSIRPLVPMLCIRPVLSIFYWSVYITFLIIGRLRSGNYAWIISMVVLLIRAASIRRVWRVLMCGLRRKNSFNQCFLISVAEPPVRKIRLERSGLRTYEFAYMSV